MNTLRRYKKHFKVSTRPGMNKAQLADVSIANTCAPEYHGLRLIRVCAFRFSLQTIMKHFKTIPIKEKETLTYFIYMVKSGSNKLDQKNGLGNDGT